MNLTIPPLALINDDLSQHADDLPQVLPHFFIPRLQEKPQDPIMDALRIERESEASRPELPPGLVNIAEVKVQGCSQDSPEEGGTLFWERAVKREVRVQNQIRSWDSLRPSFSRITSPGPFLSEQSGSTFAAARYHINPQFQDPAWNVSHVSMKELLVSIQNILVGNSSSLYQWEMLSETFVLPPTAEGKKEFIVVDGKDDSLMRSYTERFLVIGSLLRRLDIFVNDLRRRSKTEGRSLYSFAHALTTCIENIRLQLSKFPEYTAARIPLNTSALFLNHEEFEDVLEAIASLCGRSLDLAPLEYPPFSSQHEVLLSRIYTHVQNHFEKGSAHRVRAMLAYIFTVTSGDYLQSLSRSIGYHGEHTTSRSKTAFILSGLDLGEEGDQEDGDSVSNDDVEEFPNFVSLVATEILIRARKSLKFLRTAQPDHPVLQHPASRRRVSWIWTNEEVTMAWDSKNPVKLSDAAAESELDSVANSDTSLDGGVLGQFKVFDLEPGTHLAPSARGVESTLESFLANFPSYLPALTPTLSHLSDLVLSPLLAHGTAISGALISLLLSPESHLHIHSHLTLLRSYFFLTLPAFTMRLQAALFSDSDDWNFEGSTMRAMAKSTQNKRSAVPGGSHAQWAVGLGLGLAERDSWPPGGSDLSYYLRTVIVDSLESLVKLTDGQFLESSEGGRRIFAEAEYRLGFAIRDLPAGSGRERWLNPSSIEALDFLLIDYKPPPPLDVVITPEVLSKYQRIFSFILRLVRVQNALAALFRMSRESPLFPTLTSANNTLLRFRFSAQSVISAIASHVPDVAVRGNVDPFLARLSTPGTFTDVFELADAHSDMIDDVLSACLLRSSQRTAGDALRGCLELALDLCILAGDRRRGRIEEYAAMPRLEKLHASFVEKMNTLVRAVREQVEKGSASSHMSLEYLQLAAGGSGRPMATGSSGSLHHLLVKLDIGLDGRTSSFIPGITKRG